MPTSLLYADTSLPTTKDGASAEEKTEEIINYLYMLLEQLRYTLGNLGEENFNAAEKERMGKVLTEPVYAKIADSEKELRNDISVTAEGLAATIAKVDDYGQSITKLQATADGLESAVFVTDGNGQITSQTLLRQLADSLTLGVIDDNGVSKIKLTGNGVDITSTGGIDLRGMVTFNDLSGSGSTTINGDNITTGQISGRTIRTYMVKSGSDSSWYGDIQMYYRTGSPANGEDPFNYRARLMASIYTDYDGAGDEYSAGPRLFISTKAEAILNRMAEDKRPPNTYLSTPTALKLESSAGTSIESDENIHMRAEDGISLRCNYNNILIDNYDGKIKLTALGGGISFDADENVWLWAKGEHDSGEGLCGVVTIKAETKIELIAPSVVINGTEI